jgi:hypothetical protein
MEQNENDQQEVAAQCLEIMDNIKCILAHLYQSTDLQEKRITTLIKLFKNISEYHSALTADSAKSN